MTSKTVKAPNPPLRGPGGRFISKKKPAVSGEMDDQIPSRPEEVRNLIDITPTDSTTTLAELSYYGEKIRRIYKDNTWFFALEDFFPLVKIFDSADYMGLLRKQPFYSVKNSKDFLEISMQSHIPAQTSVIFGNIDVVKVIISLFQKEERYFPGRFPEWIENAADIPYEEAFVRSSLETT
ncbi:MAG: hypothetical protein ACMG6E_02045 [Candidatus Roizmanbacteria bacterium]